MAADERDGGNRKGMREIVVSRKERQETWALSEEETVLLTLELKRSLYDCISGWGEEHYVVYADGYSDRSISRDTNLPVSLVMRFREDYFGSTKTPKKLEWPLVPLCAAAWEIRTVKIIFDAVGRAARRPKTGRVRGLTPPLLRYRGSSRLGDVSSCRQVLRPKTQQVSHRLHG